MTRSLTRSSRGVEVWYQAQPLRWNRYSYVQNNPMAAIDPDGRDTYKVNRTIGGDEAQSSSNPITHTFAATTDGGKVTDTYSWGNNGIKGKWTKNAPEDMKAAQEAVDSGKAKKVGDESLDKYVDQAYGAKKDEPAHLNGVVCNNCKSEANDLIDTAKQLKDEDEKTEEQKKAEAEAAAKAKQAKEAEIERNLMKR